MEIQQIKAAIETIIYWLFCIITFGLLCVARITITIAIKEANK